MDTSPIIIAGGGIAGLAAALALGSHEAVVLEQAAAFTNAGAGIQLGPNAVRALRKLGAWDAVEPFTAKPAEIQFRDGLSGKLVKRLKLGAVFSSRYGADYHVARRADLHRGLLEVVQSRPNIKIDLGQSLQHLELGQNDVQVLIRGQSRRTPALIIADGVQSKLRQALYPGTVALKSGATFHRAFIPQVPNSNIPIDCVSVWMMPHSHVVSYAVGNPNQLNLVAIVPEGKDPVEFFNMATPDLSEMLSQASAQFSIWPALYVQPLRHWNNGNTLLLGDAAHGTLPYMAQGAAMALEDAATLQQAIKSTHSLSHALAETSQRRTSRTKRLHHETVRTGNVYHASGFLRTLRNVGLRFTPDAILQHKIDWLYKY